MHRGHRNSLSTRGRAVLERSVRETVTERNHGLASVETMCPTWVCTELAILVWGWTVRTWEERRTRTHIEIENRDLQLGVRLFYG